ncbi:hypothetical protein [Janthinobacterium sp. 17J80-10]|uniref:hypothetical protein n=1 Tax=Janthinobacterium sp. 17J80-10 TaxID=2497863 RepID=UPI0013E8E08D|nr:hypothetical protein [Janthinobacterium sp. 17J80-10]
MAASAASARDPLKRYRMHRQNARRPKTAPQWHMKAHARGICRSNVALHAGSAPKEFCTGPAIACKTKPSGGIEKVALYIKDFPVTQRFVIDQGYPTSFSGFSKLTQKLVHLRPLPRHFQCTWPVNCTARNTRTKPVQINGFNNSKSRVDMTGGEQPHGQLSVRYILALYARCHALRTIHAGPEPDVAHD